jgi:hypothetical protein
VRPRPDLEVNFLAKCVAQIAANEITYRTFKASCEELAEHWLTSLAQALTGNTYLERIMFNG